MKYTAKRNPAAVRTLVFVLYAVGVILFLIPAYASIPYAAVLQFASIATLAFAVQYTIRYMLTDFVYEIHREHKQSRPILHIYRIQGQRSTLLASIELALMTKIEKKEKIEDGVQNALNYCPSFHAKNVYRIEAKEGNKTVAIYLQCDDEFAKTLSEWITAYEKNGSYIVSEED